ncbi:GNAT family N-acetyltransferase [Streptococcus sp. X16XC17]|uniref:GNAT family N-acetyltransferase n=1 Tax=unclassified Streptococcus TaxID=2608887 RepID=UPI00066FE354|nr:MULTISPECIES: GNAT family N-acetyltransferase [unclassified Streptococcus]TCD46222.1 GNAT family N-acetyltransferase [Streptococcus sp. X16XC17]
MILFTQEDQTDFFNSVFDCQYRKNFGKENDPDASESFTIIMKSGEQNIAAMSCHRLYQTLKIVDFAVDSDFQRQGVGTKMIEFIQRFALEKEILTVILTTRSYQAKDFYLKHGFEIYGQLVDVPFKDCTTYYMALRLAK